MKDKQKEKWPNASFMLDAQECLVWSFRYSAEEVGYIFRKISDDLHAGRFDEVRKYSFVGRIYKGHIKRKSIPMEIKRRVLSSGECNHCGDTKNLTIDHIIAVSHGGGDELENLQCLCWTCNKKKGPECNGKVSVHYKQVSLHG